MTTPLQDGKIIQYLLGTLSEEETNRFEEAYFADHALLEQALAIRDELIADYINKRLPERQREQFERYFLASPQQREMVEMSTAMLQSLAQNSAESMPAPANPRLDHKSWRQVVRNFFDKRNPVLVWLPTAAFIVCLVFSGLIYGNLRQVRDELTQVQADYQRQQQAMQQQVAAERERATQLDEQLKHTQDELAESKSDLERASRPEPDLIASLRLTSDYDQGSRNSGGSSARREIVITSDKGMVEFRLKLKDEDFTSYRVKLRRVAPGGSIWDQGGLKARQTRFGKIVIVKVPARSFTKETRDYKLVLFGKIAEGRYEDEGNPYSFRVDKK